MKLPSSAAPCISGGAGKLTIGLLASARGPASSGFAIGSPAG